MKTVRGNVLTILGIVAAIVAVSCGDTIQMLGWAFVSLMLLATALVLCALGVNDENERADTEKLKKLNRIPAHTNEWRDAR